MTGRAKQPPTRVYIARHGQTETNSAGIFCGHSETALTELGRAQARALGERLASVPFTAAYTSDFSRATETAALVLGERGIQPQADPDLRELCYGEWEMRGEREVRRGYAQQYRLMRAEDPAWCPPGGEDVAAVRARTMAALERVVRRHRHANLLVITHGTAINCMLSGVLGMPLSHTFRFSVANCGLSVVEARKTGLVITTLNETAHLAGLIAPEGPAAA